MSDQDDFDMPEGEGLESSAMKQVRDHAKALEDQLKAERKWRKDAEPELERFRGTERAARVHQTFQDKGLSERDAKVFLLAHPDGEVNDERLSTFAQEWGINLTPEPEPEPKPEPVATYQPVIGGVSGQSQQRISYEEYVAARTDPAKFAWAVQMSQKGLVDDR